MNTGRTRPKAASLAEPILLSALTRLEFSNEISRRVFRGEMSGRQARAANARFEMDVEIGRFRQEDLNDAEWEVSAENLTKVHTSRYGARSLDVLHVSYALLADASEFLSFDGRQGQLAEEVGLAVTP